MSEKKGSVSNKIRKPLNQAQRVLGDVNAVEQAVKKGSVMPIVKRIANKILGRKIVSKLWLK